MDETTMIEKKGKLHVVFPILPEHIYSWKGDRILVALPAEHAKELAQRILDTEPKGLPQHREQED